LRLGNDSAANLYIYFFFNFLNFFRIQTGDGISQVESGSLKNIGSPEGPVNIKKGSYSYTGPDGILYTVNYTADENVRKFLKNTKSATFSKFLNL